MKVNEVEIVYVELCCNISISKYEKPKSNIKISKISYLPFDMFFSLKNYDTVPNAATINRFLETISCS